MRGRPLLRFFILCVFLFGMALWILCLGQTRKSDVKRISHSEGFALVEVEYRIRSTAQPQKMSLSAGGRNAFSWMAGDPDEGVFRVAIPKEGLDLILDVHWSDKGWHAMEVKLHAPAYAPFIQTFWGEEALKDVVSLRPR